MWHWGKKEKNANKTPGGWVKCEPLVVLYGVHVWNDCRIYPLAIVEAGAEIGVGCKIESFCFIEHGAVIGNRVTLKPGVHVWNGITIEDDVFVGPGAIFTNDSWPRVGRPCPVEKTVVGHGASIGAGAIILPGAIIPPHMMVAAGAVVGWPFGRWAVDDPSSGVYTRGETLRSDVRVDAAIAACEKCKQQPRVTELPGQDD